MIRTKPLRHGSFRLETPGSHTGDLVGPAGFPCWLLNYFAANMDNWDPKVTNAFAAEREVILLDNAGVGGSSGETPSTVAAMTTDCVEFCRALDVSLLRQGRPHIRDRAGS